MTQTRQVLEAIKKAGAPLTSARIKELTGLTGKQVNQAAYLLRHRGLIVRKYCYTKTTGFNRYQDLPQEWAISEDMFDE